MNTYIVSTSYGQYIEAVSDYMELPFENTFYTKVNLDKLTLNSDEIKKINEIETGKEIKPGTKLLIVAKNH